MGKCPLAFMKPTSVILPSPSTMIILFALMDFFPYFFYSNIPINSTTYNVFVMQRVAQENDATPKTV